MRLLIILFITFSASCSGQNAQSKSQVDTAKLFDPKPENDNLILPNMFNNFILINQSPFAVVIQGKQFQAKSNIDLTSLIKKNNKNVQKSKFYIIIDSSISFDKIFSTIGILKDAQIENYKVVNVDSFGAQLKQPVFEQPIITNKIVDNDSTYFSITILNDGFETKLQDKEQVLKNGDEVDKFIAENKSIIDPNKILIIGNSQLPYNKFQSLLEVLKKHNYYNFKLVTK